MLGRQGQDYSDEINGEASINKNAPMADLLDEPATVEPHECISHLNTKSPFSAFLANDSAWMLTQSHIELFLRIQMQ